MNPEQTKILLAEDDVNLGFVIRDNLEQHGFSVDLYENGEEAHKGFQSNNYDICVLDIMMPKMDGFTLATNIRQENHEIPILFLTAKTLKEDKLKGFMLGGDDYITKPFSIEELILRVNVFVRRTRTVSSPRKDIVQLGKYSFNHENLTLLISGDEKKLTQMEADILAFLYSKRNETVKRSEILTAIWGEDDYFSGRSLDVFISRLRKYLKEDEQIKISNHHGVGFKLSY